MTNLMRRILGLIFIFSVLLGSVALITLFALSIIAAGPAVIAALAVGLVILSVVGIALMQPKLISSIGAWFRSLFFPVAQTPVAPAAEVAPVPAAEVAPPAAEVAPVPTAAEVVPPPALFLDPDEVAIGIASTPIRPALVDVNKDAIGVRANTLRASKGMVRPFKKHAIADASASARTVSLIPVSDDFSGEMAAIDAILGAAHAAMGRTFTPPVSSTSSSVLTRRPRSLSEGSSPIDVVPPFLPEDVIKAFLKKRVISLAGVEIVERDIEAVRGNFSRVIEDAEKAAHALAEALKAEEIAAAQAEAKEALDAEEIAAALESVRVGIVEAETDRHSAETIGSIASLGDSDLTTAISSISHIGDGPPPAAGGAGVSSSAIFNETMRRGRNMAALSKGDGRESRESLAEVGHVARMRMVQETSPNPLADSRFFTPAGNATAYPLLGSKTRSDRGLLASYVDMLKEGGFYREGTLTEVPTIDAARARLAAR